RVLVGSWRISWCVVDRHRDRPRLGSIPRRQYRAESAGRSAGGDHQQIVRRAERAVGAVLVLEPGNRALSDRAPFAALHVRPLVDVLADATLVPAGRDEGLAM